MMGFLSADREFLSDWIDWLWTHDEEVVFTKTGGMMRVATFDPPDLETASRDELITFHKRLTELLTRPATGWSMWIDQWRREDRGYLPASDFGGNHAACLVDAARRTQFESRPRAVFTNRVYVAMHWTPQSRDALLALLHERDPGAPDTALRTFVDQGNEFLTGLRELCPSVRVLRDEALGTYLTETTTFRRVPTRLPTGYLAGQYGLADWHTGTELTVDGLHVATVEMHVFGSASPLTMERMHELPFECRWTTTVHFMDPEDQTRTIAGLRNRWRPKLYGWAGWLAIITTRDASRATPRPEIQGIMDGLDELERNLQARKDGLATATVNVRVWDADPAVAEKRAQAVVGELNAVGMRSRTATFNAVLSTLSDVPGNASRDVRSKRVVTPAISTVARCAPVTGLSTGTREDDHLKGPALLVAQSRRNVPLFWALHAPGSDVGHTAVIGRTGGGKSTLLSFMAMQYLRYPDATVTIFDKRRSAMVATLCSDDSRFIELGSGGLGVQPFRHLENPEDYGWAFAWATQALKMRRVESDARVDAALNEALGALRKTPDPNRRTITSLCAHLGGHVGALQAMRHYTREGPLGALFDDAVPSYGTARVLCIETDPIRDLAETPLIIAACFRAIERERLSGGHPKLVLIDEAWEPLQHPLFRNRIEDLSRTMRKMNGQLCLFTQSLHDLKREHTAVIMQQVETTIFTADSRAMQADNRALLLSIGLTDEQVDTISMMAPKREYLLQTPLFTRVADVRLEGAALKICGAGRDADIKRARALLDAGVAPGKEFVERWLVE